MTTLHIANSFCILEGFSEASMDMIRDTLTYDNEEALFELKSAFKMLAMAKKRRQVERVRRLKFRIKELENQLKVCWLHNGMFPTGLLHIVSETLRQVSDTYNTVDYRKVPEKTVEYVWETKLDPRYYQQEMIDLTKESHRGVFESAVGSGKSLIMRNIVAQCGVPALLVVPSRDLAVQTMTGLEESFGKGCCEVLTSALVRKSKGVHKPIRVATIQSLNALKKGGLLQQAIADIGLLCIDEAHHMGAASFTSLLPDVEHIYYRYGFSGTYLRNDSKTLDMWGILSEVLYRYPATKAIEEGFLTPLETYVYELDGDAGSDYRSEYTANYCGGRKMLKKIADIVTSETNEDDQILILVKQKDGGGKLIAEYLDSYGIDVTYISGDNKKSEIKEALTKFNAKEVKILIGSSIIGEGIDIRSTNHLIMAQGGKSEIAITQAVGRAVRLFPGKPVAKLHDFKFSGTKYLGKHLDVRVGLYEKNFNSEVYFV